MLTSSSLVCLNRRSLCACVLRLSNLVRLHRQVLCAYIVKSYVLTSWNPLRLHRQTLSAYTVKFCALTSSLTLLGPMCLHRTYITKICALLLELVRFYQGPKVPTLSNLVRLYCRTLCVFIADQEYLYHQNWRVYIVGPFVLLWY